MKFPGKSRSELLARVETLEQRTLISATVANPSALPATASLLLPALPAYSVPSSNPTLPAGVETFSPPVESGGGWGTISRRTRNRDQQPKRQPR